MLSRAEIKLINGWCSLRRVSKFFSDPVHGHIEMEPTLIKVTAVFFHYFDVSSADHRHTSVPAVASPETTWNLLFCVSWRLAQPFRT